MDAIYGNPDNDTDGGLWNSGKTGGDPTASSGHAKAAYGIQSPFTGEMHYPGEAYWRSAKSSMKGWLEGWGSKYEEKVIDDGVVFTDKKGKTTFVKALVLKGCKFQDGKPVESDAILKAARTAAQAVYKRGQWPKLFFTKKGDGAPRLKVYLKEIKQGKVVMSWWSGEDYDEPFLMGSTSWEHSESGHSQAGIKELDAVVGQGHNFQTVKPLRLIKKIIQLWCRPDGLVLDPFAGSGTTGHAVLELNAEVGANRRFILIEQGNTEKGDHYAKSLTADRLKRVLTGQWASGTVPPLPGGFRFIELKREQVDAKAVNDLAREEMIDLLLTSYWDRNEKAKSYLRRLTAGSHRHLFGVNPKNEGFFLIWDGPNEPSLLNREAFKRVVEEAKSEGLSSRYHVYASLAPYTGSDIEFYKIPESVLEHIGFNPRADAFNNEENSEE
jgi:adenine-specific DNA-methyltransferase